MEFYKYQAPWYDWALVVIVITLALYGLFAIFDNWLQKRRLK